MNENLTLLTTPEGCFLKVLEEFGRFMFIKIEQEEAKILRKMKAIDIKIYIFGMKEKADWSTWMLGISPKTKITKTDLLDLAQEGEKDIITLQMIKSSLKRLEKAGLIKKNETKSKNNMTIELIIAKKLIQKTQKSATTSTTTSATTSTTTSATTSHKGQVIENKEFFSEKPEDSNHLDNHLCNHLDNHLSNHPIYNKILLQDITTDISTDPKLDKSNFGNMHFSACAENALPQDEIKKIKKPAVKKREPAKPPMELVEFNFTEDDVDYCVQKHLPHPETEIENFKDYYLIRPKYWSGRDRISSWNLAFKGWMRRSVKFSRGGQGYPSGSVSKINRKPRTQAERVLSYIDPALLDDCINSTQGKLYDNHH